MSVRLFVGNLPYDATEDEIRGHFSPAGNLASVFIPVDRETGRKRGFAFVEFSDGTQAQEAIRLFNNQPFKGRSLAVNEARAKEPGGSRPPTRPAPMGGGGGGYRPAPFMRPSAPSVDFITDPNADSGRADRTRKFGPDAKPARHRAKTFKPEGGKKSFKEKLGGQIFGDVNEEEDSGAETEVDNFATGIEDDK